MRRFITITSTKLCYCTTVQNLHFQTSKKKKIKLKKFVENNYSYLIKHYLALLVALKS